MHVTVGIGVDPACVGYALDQLRALSVRGLVDELRATLSRDGRRTRVEVTAVLGDRVLCASAAGDGPHTAVDRVQTVVVEESGPVAG